MRQFKKLIYIGLLGIALSTSGWGQTTTPAAPPPDTSDKAQVQALKAQVDDLQTKLRLIGAALSISSGAPAPAPAVEAPAAPPVVVARPGTPGAKADAAALQAQLADLMAKYQALSETVDKQNAQLAPLHDQLDQMSKTVQDVKAAAAAAPAPAAASAPGAPAAAATPPVPDLSVNINIAWTLITGYLVMFMQAGFAMVECGFSRAKNVAHTAMLNFMVYSIGMLGYWVCGFALQFGGTGAATSVSTVTTLGPAVAQVLNQEIGITIGGHYYGLCGASGFFLGGNCWEPGIFTLFLFQMVFMDTTAIIPTGALAERWKFLSFALFSFCVGTFIYPVFGNWVWGGGWLAALGKNFGLGHGHTDFAGSSVVHVAGGTIAFVGAMMLGPRLGKYNADGSPNPIPGHNLPMAVLGTFILAFGWFGFNPGSTLAATDTQIGIIATNTMLASGSGAVFGMLISWFRIGKPDPSFACNGMLGGLVAITGPCAFVDAWAAVLLGAVAALVMYCSVFFVEEKLKIDDPAGAISVHGMTGLWGEVGLGLFANGKYGEGWNGVSGKVTGLFYGDYTQLLAELIGDVACITWVGLTSCFAFFIINKLVGNRVTAEAELEGLDIPEMGTLGYNNDV